MCLDSYYERRMVGEMAWHRGRKLRRRSRGSSSSTSPVLFTVGGDYDGGKEIRSLKSSSFKAKRTTAKTQSVADIRANGSSRQIEV